jgi:IMP dehydrogenase
LGKIIGEPGLTFDDVLLVPRKASVGSRSDIDLRTQFSRRIRLNVPLVSANMDTVTESRMAIAMAQLGGIGVIHRFLPAEQQADEVRKVKRFSGLLVENPYTIGKDAAVAEAVALMAEKGVSGLICVDGAAKIAGILTKRDVQAAKGKEKVAELMTGKNDLITARLGAKPEYEKRLMLDNRIEKLPIVDADGSVRGLVTLKDILHKSENPLALKDAKGKLKVAAAVGVKDGELERAQALVAAGADALVVDVAHGHADHVMRTIERLKERFPKTDVIGGNVATAEGAKELIAAGADAVKVGVGPGSICITRIVAGAGVPQLTAIMECARVADRKGVPIIADGGIRNSGDLAKAIGAGASCVMIGSLFAGTDESPGVTIYRNGARYKFSRGMASLGAAVGRGAQAADYVPEGVEAVVPYEGAVVEVARQLLGGLRSGASYCGAASIASMRKTAKFVRITSAGLQESRPHDVKTINGSW